jgi:hypothetical protein
MSYTIGPPFTDVKRPHGPSMEALFNPGGVAARNRINIIPNLAARKEREWWKVLHQTEPPNATGGRNGQPEKESLPSVITEEGMQIDESDKPSENADAQIHERREPLSNDTRARHSHPVKQLS